MRKLPSVHEVDLTNREADDAADEIARIWLRQG
jgi:hypothetical protein